MNDYFILDLEAWKLAEKEKRRIRKLQEQDEIKEEQREREERLNKKI